MEEGAGDAGRDGDQVGLAGEDFDLGVAGEVGEIDGASAADAGDGGVVGGDGGERGEKFAGVDEEGFQGARLRVKVPTLSRRTREGWGTRLNCGSGWFRDGAVSIPTPTSRKGREKWGTRLRGVGEFFQGVGVGEGEFGDGGATEGFQVRAAGQFPAHVVGDGAHVGSGGDAGPETDAIEIDGEDFEFFDIDFDGLEHNFFLLAGEFVGGDAFYFLGGEGRRSLLDDAAEAGGESFDPFWVQAHFLRRGGGFAFGVVGVGGEAEADGAFVSLF